ncbi:ABC transporter substrate-binding protein [candidate division KSB1 bacterium]|nr:ABC transporter substrate-binding protein [candidate division KSB1 bacterium]
MLQTVSFPTRLGAIIILLAQIILSCSNQQNPTLIYGLKSVPAGLAPEREPEYFSSQIIPHIHETLVAFSDDSLVFEPMLARSWTHSPDGLYWTFSLRDNVVFHDDTPFSAQSVKFSFRRLIDPLFQFYLQPGSARDAFDMIQNVEVVDSLTVAFRLKYPYAPFLNILADPMTTGIISPAALMKYGSDITRHPVGTGPFKFIRWDSANHIFLEHYTDYWRKSNPIDLEFRVIDDSEQQILLLKESKLDIVVELSPKYLFRVNQTENIETHWHQVFHTYFLGFNCERPPFNNPELRLAMAQVINRNDIVQRFLDNSAHIAYSLIPENLLNVPPWSNLEQNTEKAVTRARKLHLNNDEPLKLICYHPNNERIGVFVTSIIDDIETLGLQVESQYFYVWSEYDRAVKAGDGHLFLDGWKSMIADPDDFYSFLFYSFDKHGVPNLFRYKNSTIDSLVLAGRQNWSDAGQRDEIYREVESVLSAEMPCVPLFHRKLCYVINSRVKNFKTNYIGIPHLDQVELISNE